MKRSFIIALCVAGISVFFASCVNKKNENSITIGSASESKNASIKKTDDIGYDELKAFFKPTFEAVLPEDSVSGGEKKASSAQKKSMKSSESVIPGLRKLSDYKISYSIKRKEFYKSSAETENLSNEKPDEKKSDGQKNQAESENSEKEFFVEDWGPQKIVSESENPTFYVVFSQPAHRLSALEKPSETSEIMSISPKLKGTFHWYGTKHLAFEAEEPAAPGEQYTIQINENLKSLGGKTLVRETSFKPKAEELKIMNLFGGFYKAGNSYKYCSDYESGVPPKYANTFYVRFNYPLAAEKLNEILEVEISKKIFNFSAVADYNENAFYWSGVKPKFDKTEQKSNSFIVTIGGEIPFNSSVYVKIKNSRSKKSYQTLRKFAVSDVSNYTDYSENKKLNPLSVRFTQTPDLQSLIQNTKFDFDFTLTENNVSVNGKNAYFFNLPVSKQEKHSISFNENLKDIYGQNLSQKEKISYGFSVSSPVSYSKFLNYGAKIMEAQFPHKIIFEYQNILPASKYWIGATDNPFDLSIKNLNGASESSKAVLIEPGKQDERHFTEIDLNPYLKDGLGAVKFEAAIERERYNSWKDATETVYDQNVQTIQVTDIGATVRFGVNKLVALATSLKTGKPIENAEVQIFINFNGNEKSSPFAAGKTNKNGLCVIDFTEKEFKALQQYFNEKSYDEQISVKVINGNDSMIFYPDSHNPYENGVDTASLLYAISEKQRTFVFVDRGVYKPGETVTFRGIDRTQHLGRILTHKGGYKIRITDGAYYRPEIVVPEWSGNLSESGGFYGSFKLPDEIKPGSYCIEYEREENFDEKSNTGYNTRCYFTVAEFERLKIESSVNFPEITYYGGDKINAHLSADYLAGGALANASYKVSWFRKPAVFAPESVETNGFEFGPDVNYSERDFYDEGKGNLNSSGTAELSSNSEKISNGSPYQYRIETAVTDVSNQRVASVNSVLVHPAEFYVGLKRNRGGFEKKGSKLDVNYILVNPDGTKINSPEKVGGLEYSLTRSVWTLVNEKSVYNSVYTRYQRSEKEEAHGKIEAKPEGKLSLDLPEAGWYKLKVSGTDREKRYVETEIGFYVAGSGAAWRGSENSESINLTPSQSEYNPGDKAQILMESPLPAGDYLITVEREGIFSEEIRHFDESANIIEIPVSKNYVPVVYVSISSYSVRNGEPAHEYGEPDLDKPKGYYGVTALFVNPKVQAFSVDIECDKPSYRPGEQVTVTLTATKGGKPYSDAELTLLAVDRGVLDLINYHVPNPIDFFYSKSKFPLCVKGGDSRAYLLDPVTYSIKNLQGGDSADDEKEDERKDFRPTAVFEPVLVTDKNGQAKCTFTLPDNLTTYRITAFGAKDDVFALKENEIKVQNPMNVQVVQPRRLRERDTAETGVLITNLDSKAQKVTVKASVEPLSQEMAADINYVLDDGIAVVPGKAFYDGKTENSVTVESGDSSVVYFDLAAEKQGVVQLTFEIKSEILNEKIKVPLKIEKTFTYETVTMIGTVGADEKNAKEEIIIPGFAEEGELKFTLDASRLGMLGGAVNYLFSYPYGCLEQQSSKVLPLVIFGDYIDVFGLDSEVSSPEKVVKRFVNQWGKVQRNDGGFPYWPESFNSSYYVSARIAHIYAAALKRGYKASGLKIDISSLLGYLKDYSGRSSYLKSYTAYVLSLFDTENASATANAILSELYSEKDERNLTELAYMGLAYKNLGNGQKSKEMAETVRQYLQPSERSVSIIEKERARSWYMFESETEQMAAILQLLSVQNPDDTMVDRLIFTLMQNQSKGYWQNTAATAHVLDAIYTYIKMRNLDETNFSANVNLNKKQIMSGKFEGAAAKPKTLSLGFADEQIAKLPREKPIPLTFEKDGKGWLFYTMEMKYALPDEMLTMRDEGLKVSLEITDSETKQAVNKADGTSLVSLESGKLYNAKVRVESTKDRSFVALRCPIPSGAEIIDSTFVTSGSDAETEASSGWKHWIDNKTIYDNEIQFFWNDFGTGSAEISFTFRAVRRGVYPTPPVAAECMYEPEILGRNEGYLFTIK